MIRELSRFKNAILVSLAVILLTASIVAAAGVISNLWTSPNVIVTQGSGGGNPPPQNVQLVISSPDFTADKNIFTGGTVTANVTLSNPSPAGAPGYTGVRVLLGVHKAGISLTDLTLEYEATPGVWQALPLTAGTDVLTAEFGPAEGFAVPSGYNVSTAFRAVINAAGTYSVTAQAHN